MFPFKSKTVVPLPETRLKTILPTDIPESVKAHFGQPQSRTNVINIIDGNVEHEIESIDFELSALAKRQDYLMRLKAKYVKVLQAITDDE